VTADAAATFTFRIPEKTVFRALVFYGAGVSSGKKCGGQQLEKKSTNINSENIITNALWPAIEIDEWQSEYNDHRYRY